MTGLDKLKFRKYILSLKEKMLLPIVQADPNFLGLTVKTSFRCTEIGEEALMKCRELNMYTTKYLDFSETKWMPVQLKTPKLVPRLKLDTKSR